jgi:hypothetical protein
VLNESEESILMKAFKLGLAALAVLVLGGCAFFFNFTAGPKVTISATKTTVSSGEITTLTATVTDENGLVSYKWYENDVDLNVATSAYSYSKFITSSENVTIKVKITDGDGKSATDAVVISVVRPTYISSVNITNYSSYDIYYLYVSPASSLDWGPDQLRSSPAIYALGGTSALDGIPDGNWDLRAVSASSAHTWTLSNQSVNHTLSPYTWDLTNANQDL